MQGILNDTVSGESIPLPPFYFFPSFSLISEICIFLKMKNRRDDTGWPEGKRMAMEDRYRPDFPRPDHRFHHFDYRDRGRYQEHVADRSVPHPSPAGVGLHLFSYWRFLVTATRGI